MYRSRGRNYKVDKDFWPSLKRYDEKIKLSLHPSDHEYQPRTVEAGYYPASDLCQHCGHRPAR